MECQVDISALRRLAEGNGKLRNTLLRQPPENTSGTPVIILVRFKVNNKTDISIWCGLFKVLRPLAEYTRGKILEDQKGSKQRPQYLGDI